MNSTTLRQIWTLVEATQTATLITLDDSKLVERLIQQLGKQCSLSREETDMASGYIRSRLPLVRDLAQSRRLGYI